MSSSNERVSDARLEHLIRIAEMDCRKTSILLKDGGYSEGNIPAAQLRALTELRERRAVETDALTPSQIGQAIADNCELAPLPHPPRCECRLCLPVKASDARSNSLLVLGCHECGERPGPDGMWHKKGCSHPELTHCIPLNGE